VLQQDEEMGLAEPWELNVSLLICFLVKLNLRKELSFDLACGV